MHQSDGLHTFSTLYCIYVQAIRRVRLRDNKVSEIVMSEYKKVFNKPKVHFVRKICLRLLQIISSALCVLLPCQVHIPHNARKHYNEEAPQHEGL